MTFSAPCRRRILVIDDDPAVLGLMDETLASAGYTVLLAQSGASALEVVERTVPDLVLVDALMPGMTGWEVCGAFRQLPHLKSVPLIFMTGLTETENVLRAFDVGAVDYVTKPLRLEEVLARISVHMEAASRMKAAYAVLDNAGRFLFAANHSGSILWSTPQAGVLLEKIPANVLSATNAELRSAPGSIVHREIMGENEILVVMVGATGEDELLFRISSRALLPEKTLQEKLGLSAREAEVLLWISRGKTSRDIADILNVSPRTVDKHIEQIYNKTGLSTRSTAAATASRLLQER